EAGRLGAPGDRDSVGERQRQTGRGQGLVQGGQPVAGGERDTGGGDGQPLRPVAEGQISGLASVHAQRRLGGRLPAGRVGRDGSGDDGGDLERAADVDPAVDGLGRRHQRVVVAL